MHSFNRMWIKTVDNVIIIVKNTELMAYIWKLPVENFIILDRQV